MKKILITCIFMLLLGANVHAEETKLLEFEYSKGIESRGTVAYFNDDILIGADVCDVIIGDKVCRAEISMPDDADNVRIYFPKTQTVVKKFKVNEEQKPTEDEEVSEEKPSVYPTEHDAATAFMFVKSAERAVDNGEEKTKLEVFFRGEEMELWIDDDITLKSVPTLHSELEGAKAYSLEKGDVIYCATNLNGKLRSVELIYRPSEKDIVVGNENFGNNFEMLFSLGNMVTTVNPVPIATYGGKNNLRQQYAFGVIKDVKNTKYVTLCNKSGEADKEMIIDLSANTVVYVYDKSLRNKVYIGDVGDIEKSEITDIDNDGNVTKWNSDCIHNYALVRMADGVALDIAVYRGY